MVKFDAVYIELGQPAGQSRYRPIFGMTYIYLKTHIKAGMLPNPQAYLKNLPDPRRETKNKLHKLEDIRFCRKVFKLKR